jgi:hypothetical protein
MRKTTNRTWAVMGMLVVQVRLDNHDVRPGGTPGPLGHEVTRRAGGE